MSSKSPHCQAVGQMYHQFRVTTITDIPELHCQLIELVHVPTGAQVMYIGNDDPENLFCLSFQTLPDSSNGVAHILEHTVLCGSKKFPVKDPFFAMQRRSLNTFMNALTGADFTCYPAASQVSKDLYNLLEVYIDAVFHPNLDELSFLQEGHRLEFATPTDPETHLEYKGVVFNEMKGALGSAEARMSEAISQALLPDLTYGYNSGGDPKEIPGLTYQQLRDFHKEYYHPSRCLFFFYGDIPLERHLDFIESHVLQKAHPLPPLPKIPLQQRFKEPKRLVMGYPIAAEESLEDKTMISFAWLTCHILQQEELLALTIVEIILMDTDASPLKMALLKSGLCKQASAYMEEEISEVPVVILLKGCNPESADAIEQLIRDTLTNVVKTGIPLESVDNAIHQLEFHRSEITGDSAPFGLSLFMRSALLKQHGGESTSGLKIHSLFDEIRKRNLVDPNYLTGLITKHFIDNPHLVRIVMVPNPKLAAEELAVEKATLAAIQEKLSKKEKKVIVDQAAELVSFQRKQEEIDLDILPKVSLDDVPHDVRVYPLIEESVGKMKVFHHNAFTNEIVYATLIFNLPPLLESDLPYVRLLTTLMGQMGCGGRDYAKNLEYIQANTGGIGAFLSLNTQAKDSTQFFPALYIRGKALHRKVPNLFALMRELVSTVDFGDVDRLKEVILKQYISLQSSLNQNALKYAINLSAIGLDISSKVSSQWYGLEYFWKIQQIAHDFDSHAEWLIAKLKELQQHLFAVGTPDLVLTCNVEMYDQIKGHHFYGLQSLQNGSSTIWQPDFKLVPSYSQGRIISSPVAFTGKVLKTVSYTHKDAPALNIASYLCDNLTLHTRVREQGGAYGGGAVSNPMSANFYFYSYRDPNVISTLDAFNEAVNNLSNGNFDASDIEEAKLEMVQTLDSPVSPGSRGDIAYGWLREGKSTETRQSFRNRILNLNRDDIVGAVQRQLAPHLESAATVVFASKELLEKENAKLTATGKEALPIESI